jgi:NSS family neurotransmitter:Na+ symporter
MKTPHWTNRLSFIITTAAFAIGIGNIWRFPYITGEGGGGAFLLVYIGLVFLVGIPILLTEIALGRMSDARPLTGFRKLGGRRYWNGIGWVGLLANLLIMGYYVMILAWVLIYGYECLSGNLQKMEASEFSGHFDSIVSDQLLVLLVVAGIMLLAAFIVSRGLQNGLERYSKWMMIAFMIIIAALALWATTLEGAAAGYAWYLTPDFSKINLDVVLTALGQLFFSVGVGMAIAFAFGSYTDRKENLIVSTVWIIFLDTLFAVLAGFMIFPALFTLGLAPDSGPNLVFITMASVFSALPLGSVIGSVFFLLLFLGGFTSLIASIQGVKDSFEEKFDLSFSQALGLSVGIIFLIAVPSAFSYVENPWLIFGKTFYGFIDFLTSIVMLPLSGLLIILFGGYVVGANKLKEHISQGAENFRFWRYWGVIVKIVVPVSMLIILLNSILG